MTDALKILVGIAIWLEIELSFIIPASFTMAVILYMRKIKGERR